MSKRQTVEARVLAYFTDAPLEAAYLMQGLVRDVVKRRAAQTAEASPAARAMKKLVRRKKTDAVAVKVKPQPEVEEMPLV